MKYKPNTKLSVVISLVLVLLITVGAAYAGAYTPDTDAELSPAVSAGVPDAGNEAEPDIQEKNGGSGFQSMTINDSKITATLAQYQDGYIVVAEASNFRKEEMHTPVTIGAGEDAITLYFADSARSFSGNQTVQEAAYTMVQNWNVREHSRFSAESGEWFYYVTEVAGPYRETPSALAQQFYHADNVMYFAAVYESVDDAAYQTLLNQSVQDGKINFFSILIGKSGAALDADALAETFYQNGQINFFAVIIPQVSDEKRIDIFERTISDDKINFFSVLLNEIEDFDFSAFAEEAYQRGQINFFAVVLSKLEDEKKAEFFSRAYEDDKINFFSVLLRDVEDIVDLSVYRQRAYNEGKRNFFYVLWEN